MVPICKFLLKSEKLWSQEKEIEAILEGIVLWKKLWAATERVQEFKNFNPLLSLRQMPSIF